MKAITTRSRILSVAVVWLKEVLVVIKRRVLYSGGMRTWKNLRRL